MAGSSDERRFDDHLSPAICGYRLGRRWSTRIGFGGQSARSPHLALSCCPPIVKAAQELLDGYYTEKTMEWVPYSKALRSVNIAAPPRKKSSTRCFGGTVAVFVLDEICSSSFLPNASIHGYPAGRGTTTKHNTHTCTSPWGRITWCNVFWARGYLFERNSRGLLQGVPRRSSPPNRIATITQTQHTIRLIVFAVLRSSARTSTFSLSDIIATMTWYP